tara:strand:+ start:9672 stop:12311 length:2640 start_codon:yes stop_codon:yes gene_type:complete
MYRNIAYLSRQGTVRLYTWDGEGSRVHYDLPYRPYYYVETTNSNSCDAMSLYNTPLKKREFPNEYHRRQAIQKLKNNETGQFEDIRLFENIGTQQQFLIDQYHQQNDSLDFSQFPIKFVFIDIETYSPNEFPSPEKAKDTINVITCYDSITQKFYTWGLGDWKHSRDDVIYVSCVSERELLVKFIDWIKKDPPDILSGWNSELFDIPYIINRVMKVLGEDSARELSPVQTIYSRDLVSQFGKYNTRWHIKGMSCVDYLDVYKKFSQGLRQSYKLDDIAEHELNQKKVDYGDQSLAELSQSDWQTFVDYNIQDVNLLVRMEEKLRYLELLRMLAYTGLTPFENAMGTLNVITGAGVIEARKQNMIVPTFVKPVRDTGKFEGAYVGEPKRGFQDYIISFDVNSLYPNVMISLNLSPETKMGKFEIQSDGKVLLTKAKGKPNTLTKENLYKGVKEAQLSVSRAQVLFSQKNKGIFPQIVDNFYKERVKIRREMNKYKRQLASLEKDDLTREQLKDKINKLHIKQFTIKIFINTVYGYFGNKHAPMGDTDISRSITLTGQGVIKESNKILVEYIKDKCNLTDEHMEKDSPIVYNDTDSVYITIKHLVNHLQIPFTNNRGNISKEVLTVVQDIEDHLNDKIKQWGERALNSKDCRFVFKRESICDVGLFLQKKRYILHVLDDEGIKVNKFKYTGVEVVRTTMPKPVKPYVKKIIETMLMTKDFNETNTVLNEAYDIFKLLPIEDIAFVMGISRFKTERRDEYGNVIESCDGFKTYKGMPIHVKSAYYYNILLDRFKLTNKYEDISSGDKVRYFYVKQPNKFGIKSFAYKYNYPIEFKNCIEPDIEMMFDKIIYSVIERLYESVNWKPRKPGQLVQTDLFKLLGD